MYEFKGIDLSTKYIKPSTWDWLCEATEDSVAPINCNLYDDGQGILIWTYSCSEGGDGLPDDLTEIVRAAFEHDWRFIVLDCDGADCELFTNYEEEWD